MLVTYCKYRTPKPMLSNDVMVCIEIIVTVCLLLKLSQLKIFIYSWFKFDLINWNAARHVLYYSAVSFLLFISRSVSLVCVAVFSCRSHEWRYACSPMVSWFRKTAWRLLLKILCVGKISIIYIISVETITSASDRTYRCDFNCPSWTCQVLRIDIRDIRKTGWGAVGELRGKSGRFTHPGHSNNPGGSRNQGKLAGIKPSETVALQRFS